MSYKATWIRKVGLHRLSIFELQHLRHLKERQLGILVLQLVNAGERYYARCVSRAMVLATAHTRESCDVDFQIRKCCPGSSGIVKLRSALMLAREAGVSWNPSQDARRGCCSLTVLA